MSIILKEVKKIIKEIDKKGISINNTKELQNIFLSFNLGKMNLKKEEKEIKKYYNKNIEDYESRLELERTHYERLEAELKHEVTRTQWFSNLDKKNAIVDFAKVNNIDKSKVEEFNSKFDLSDFSGRRNIIHSMDCISTIQLLFRDRNFITTFIRSSDVIRLLPIDILFLCNLLYKILNYYNLKSTKKDILKILIVSCHFYDKDKKIVKKILKE